MKMKNILGTLKTKAMAVGMGASAAITSVALSPMNVFASESGSVDLNSVTSPIIGLVNSILNAAIPLVAAVGTLYCVILGVKFAQAEEPQDREKAKAHLKNSIIGFVLIFVLIVALRIGTPILVNWMNANS